MIRTWQLTSLDTFCLGMVIKGAWVYKELPSYDTLCEALKPLLEAYPQLLGRYNEEIKSVVWDDEVGGDIRFEQVNLQNHTTGEDPYKLVTPFDTNAYKKGRINGFSATLLKLRDGITLVVQCAHATMDGSSFYTFVRQWAALTRGEEIAPMVVDQSLLPSKTALSKENTLARIEQLGWTKIGFKKLFKMMIGLGAMHSVKPVVAFELSQEEIARMKAEKNASTNAVLCEYATSKLMEHLPEQKEFTILQVADLRGRSCDIPENFMGNFAQPVIIGKFSRDDFSASDISSKVAAALSQTAILSENIQLSLCSSHYSLPYFYFDASDMNSRKPGTVYINNQLKLRANETDFGTGLPLRVEQAGLADMIKFWQPVAGGPVQIIYGGFAAKIIKG